MKPSPPPRGISIRWLLLGANLLVLTLPLVALFGLRIYDTYLLRQTERQLIAQAAFVAEVWRDALADTGGRELLKEFRPPNRSDATFVPIAPKIDLGTDVLPPQPTAPPCPDTPPSDFTRAAQRVIPLLRRAQVFTLSAIRILDTRGCVIATTRGEAGASMARFVEVRRALAGHYSAVTRRRVSDDPTPPLIDVRRRGTIRVFSALPVFSHGRVIGVVRISRTSLSAFRSLWLNRRGLLMGVVLCGFIVLLASLLFAKAITRPLRRLREDAQAIVQGQTSSRFAQRAWTPVELKAVARALATMTEKLRERAEYTAAYAANVTHELKTPITSIRGAAELLRDGMDSMDPAQQRRFLSNIEADALRMERLVNQLLQLTRIENAVSDAAEGVEVMPFFQQLTERYTGRVSLQAQNPPKSIQINIDHLNSAVTNLVENALEQDPNAHVDITLSGDGDRLVVSVADNGPGVPEPYLGKIFDRFFTTKADQGGTGLGLSLVKAIAEARAGSVAIASQPGATTFTLVL